METFDILIYAGLTAFLAYRLWSVLGQKEEGGEEGKPPRPNPFARAEKPKESEQPDNEGVIVLEGRARAGQAFTSAGPAPASLAGAIEAVRTLDKSFDEKRFLEGAKTLFSRVITAFAAGDLSGVRRFLDAPIAASFQAAIDARKAEGQTLTNSIERMAAADIIAAQTAGSLATLSVEFVSHQVNVLRGADGAVIEGQERKAEEVRDIWVFRRDMTAADPAWLLIETRS